MTKLKSNLLISTLVIALSGIPIGFNIEAARADIIDLAFSLDSSGSVGSSNWTLITSGLANALNEVPLTGDDQYRISVVGFSSSAFDIVLPTTLTSDNLAIVQSQITSSPFTSGVTCISCSIDLLTANKIAAGGFGNKSLINISTDGAPNVGNVDGINLRESTIASGWDGLSAEAIGSFNLSFLSDLVFPQPPFITDDPSELPTINPFEQGFVLQVENFEDYEFAITDKVGIITNGETTPEPRTFLGLFLVGGLGFGLRRRKQS